MRVIFLCLQISCIALFFSFISCQNTEINGELYTDEAPTDSPEATSSDTYSEETGTENVSETENNTSEKSFYDNEAQTTTELNLNDTDTTTFHTTEITVEAKHSFPIESPVYSYDNVCTCNLINAACEINCCCDDDCSKDDIKVFTHCQSEHTHVDKNYCFNTNIIYRNNTFYKNIIKSENLFCIARDNFKKRIQFKDIPKYQNIDEFNKLKKQEIFSWDDVKQQILPKFTVTKAGDPLFITLIGSSRQSLPWYLPSPCFSKSCICRQNILYLKDFHSACTYDIQNLEEECNSNTILSAKYYEHFCLQKLPSENLDINSFSVENMNLINDTEASNNYYVQTNCISTKNVKTPVYEKNTRKCKNIVTGVYYTVTHAGINGIDGVTVRYTFDTISQANKTFIQNFNVVFKWNSSNIDEMYQRSGNPGYQIGLPVLAGELVNVTDAENKKSVLQVRYSSLSILKSDTYGLCNTERTIVHFGQNMKTGCILKNLANSCNNIQKQIYAVLTGFEKISHIGIFGNANNSKVSDWIKIFHKGKTAEESMMSQASKICNLIKGLKIDIAYAAAGSAANPQYKIIGVIYQYFTPESVDLECVSNTCSVFHPYHLSTENLYISMSVSFFDVSEPAVVIYKKPPVINAKLPHDFFYPFLLSSAMIQHSYFYICFTFVNILIYTALNKCNL